MKLAGKAFIILSTISIIGLAIAYQYFCEAPMAELNTKLNTTEKKMQAAYDCEIIMPLYTIVLHNVII